MFCCTVLFSFLFSDFTIVFAPLAQMICVMPIGFMAWLLAGYCDRSRGKGFRSWDY